MEISATAPQREIQAFVSSALCTIVHAHPLYNNVMPASIFEQKKQKILSSLSVPGEEYTDLSPKGSVDEGIRDLITEINSYAGLVTTSSCAGRVSIFLEGQKSSKKNKSQIIKETESGPTGKGGGAWLFVSHDPVTIDDGQTSLLVTKFGMETREARVVPDACPLVHFKFEPMILHILCASLAEAGKVLNAASQAGFRESGAVSIMPAKNGSTTPIVAVRSAGLCFDSIVGFQAEEGNIVSIVDEAYLALLIRLGNARFNTNKERIDRFRTQLQKLQLALGQ